MVDYWRDAIGATYQPVKWVAQRAAHPASVRDVLARLKAGEACPEAADVIVALVHTQSAAWNTAAALSREIRERGDADGRAPAVGHVTVTPRIHGTAS
jgi:hypothetical protein